MSLKGPLALLVLTVLISVQITSGALIQESVQTQVRERTASPQNPVGRSNSKDVPTLQRLNLRPLIISNRSRVIQQYIRSHLVDRATGRFNVDLIRELLNEQRAVIRGGIGD